MKRLRPKHHVANPQPAIAAEMGKKTIDDFYSLYDAHYDRIKGFILAKVRDKWIAEDLTQDAFLRAFRTISSLREPSKVSGAPFMRHSYKTPHRCPPTRAAFLPAAAKRIDLLSCVAPFFACAEVNGIDAAITLTEDIIPMQEPARGRNNHVT